jgi:hypothetical protein
VTHHLFYGLTIGPQWAHSSRMVPSDTFLEKIII